MKHISYYLEQVLERIFDGRSEVIELASTAEPSKLHFRLSTERMMEDLVLLKAQVLDRLLPEFDEIHERLARGFEITPALHQRVKMAWIRMPEPDFKLDR